MAIDFLIGIAASLVASFISGFFTTKLFGKNSSDVFLKIYTIYVSGSAFIISLLFAYMVNSNIIKMIADMTDVNIFTIYKYSSTLFVWMFSLFAIITVIFLIVRQMDVNSKEMKKIHTNTMKLSKKCGEDK